MRIRTISNHFLDFIHFCNVFCHRSHIFVHFKALDRAIFYPIQIIIHHGDQFIFQDYNLSRFFSYDYFAHCLNFPNHFHNLFRRTTRQTKRNQDAGKKTLQYISTSVS